MSNRKRPTDLVTIEIEEPIPDVLQRITLLHAAFIRVLIGTRLIEVIEADYEIGKLVLIVESRESHPKISGKICIRYESCLDAENRESKIEGR